MPSPKVLEGKPLKRIELKVHSKNSKARLRASRTGGINGAYHPVKGITFNTKYGIRASKTFRGVTLGFQGGKAVFRGRWSSKNGLLNTNLSRSGLSFSTKSNYGTYNWTRPNYSSFKFAGIQIRGKKASGLAFIFALITLIPVIIKLVFNTLIFAFNLISFLCKLIPPAISLVLNIIILLWNILIRVSLFIFNTSLFIAWDLPRQIVNLAIGNSYFDLEEEAITDANIEKDHLISKIAELEKKHEEVEHEREPDQNIDKNSDFDSSSQINILEAENKFEKKSSIILARIAEIDDELQKINDESTIVLFDNKPAIQAQIMALESNIKDRQAPESGPMVIISAIAFLFGITLLLVPFSILVSFFANASEFINMETSGLVFIILIGSILGVLGWYATKPGIKLIKNYQDKKNLRNLKENL